MTIEREKEREDVFGLLQRSYLIISLKSERCVRQGTKPT